MPTTSPPKLRSSKEVRAAAAKLRCNLLRVLAGLESEYPERQRSRMSVHAMRAESGDYPLHMIVSPLDDALESFDRLQQALGRPLEDTRFHKFLRGQCRCDD